MPPKKSAQQVERKILLSEDEKKAIENKDKVILRKIIEDYILQNKNYQDKVYLLDEQLQEMRIQSKQINQKLLLKKDEALSQNEVSQQEYDAFQIYKKETEQEILEKKNQEYLQKMRYFENEILDKDQTIRELTGGLSKFDGLQKKEDSIIADLKELNQTYLDQIYSFNDELRKLEKENHKQRTNILNIQQAQSDEISKNAQNMAETAVQQEEEQTKTQNTNLSKNLEIQQKQFEAVKKEKIEVAEKNMYVKRDISLFEQRIEEYGVICQKKEQKIKVLKEQIKYLKSYISDQVSKFTKEMESNKMKNQVELRDMEAELSNLKRVQKQQNDEFQKLTQLAQEIVQQRQLIQEFFIQSLQQVREQIVKQNSNLKITIFF